MLFRTKQWIRREEGEPYDIFDIANMEWKKYIPGVTDTPKEKPPPESAVRKIVILETRKESRQEIELMEVDIVTIRKAKKKKTKRKMKVKLLRFKK